MTNYELGDVILLAFPHTDLRSISKRPALVLFDGGDVDLVVSRITSQPQTGTSDYKIVNWRNAGLLSNHGFEFEKLRHWKKV